MSHRLNCPSDWEARREGERAHESGRSRSSNPYEDHYWNRDRACPDAAEEWRRGFLRAEIREEERREEEVARRRAAWRRAEADAEEAYYAEQEAYYSQHQPYDDDRRSEEEYVRDMCASNGHIRYDQAGDRFGPRCYCGRVRWAVETPGDTP